MKKTKYTITDTSLNGRLEALEQETNRLGKRYAFLHEWIQKVEKRVKEWEKCVTTINVSTSDPPVTSSSGEWCECKKPNSYGYPRQGVCSICEQVIKPLPSHDIREKLMEVLNDESFEGKILVSREYLADKILEVIHEK